MGSARTLQLYIFETAPRAMPPYTDPSGLSSEALVRAIQRAAWHPWRDARFWHRAADKVALFAPAQLRGRHLAQACAGFRRIEFASPVLSEYCKHYMREQQHTLNTMELAGVLSYVANANAGAPDVGDFVREVADEACNEWRQRETVPWSAWRTLVSSAAHAGVVHRELFTTAAPHLAQSVKFMNGRDAIEVCSAYATFRFKHHALLNELSRFLPSMGLTDAEVESMQAAFRELEFDAPLLRRIRELRGGAGASWGA